MSTKKAVIIVELGYESNQASNTQIEKDIKKEAQIPWSAKSAKSKSTTASDFTGGSLVGYLPLLRRKLS